MPVEINPRLVTRKRTEERIGVSGWSGWCLPGGVKAVVELLLKQLLLNADCCWNVRWQLDLLSTLVSVGRVYFVGAVWTVSCRNGTWWCCWISGKWLYVSVWMHACRVWKVICPVTVLSSHKTHKKRLYFCCDSVGLMLYIGWKILYTLDDVSDAVFD